MKKQAPAEEKGEGAPLWIISFADMISLLMAFFVMLLTMATSRSGSLCENGQGVFERSIQGFRNSISSFGIPGLIGSGKNLGFDRTKRYFPVSGEDKYDTGERLIDAGEEKMKRIFRQLKADAATSPSSIKGARDFFKTTPISFCSGSCELTSDDKQYLGRFCADIKASLQLDNIAIIVAGAAPDAATFKEKWTLAARRADIVAEYIKQSFPGSAVDIFSWGASKASVWDKDTSSSADKAHIILSILKKEETAEDY